MTFIANWLYKLQRRWPRGPARTGIVETFDDPRLGNFRKEFIRLLKEYCYPDGLVDPARLDELDQAYSYLDEIARGDVDAFIAEKQEWKLYSGAPVYLIERRDLMLAFVIAAEPDADTVVIVALGCTLRSTHTGQEFWLHVVEPRLGALFVERAK